MTHLADTADIDTGPFLEPGSPQPLGASLTPSTTWMPHMSIVDSSTK